LVCVGWQNLLIIFKLAYNYWQSCSSWAFLSFPRLILLPVLAIFLAPCQHSVLSFVFGSRLFFGIDRKLASLQSSRLHCSHVSRITAFGWMLTNKYTESFRRHLSPLSVADLVRQEQHCKHVALFTVSFKAPSFGIRDLGFRVDVFGHFSLSHHEDRCFGGLTLFHCSLALYPGGEDLVIGDVIQVVDIQNISLSSANVSDFERSFLVLYHGEDEP
jgi:hypothetical protein